ncbi:nucleoside diphosphate kinase, mitochondrial [Sceloporus undulatus]|uniref:nucleoside diphosphate kinase, mitochondrial n=1 Tax=Sceloporus undulatus TaxID=8520 RepID=UPI001C4AFC87|nr:nucleoside diphosphate kinase, mitochondrial [Sceloporus undulatus]
MVFLRRCCCLAPGRRLCLLGPLPKPKPLGALGSPGGLLQGQPYSTGQPTGLQERTLIALKPDGVQRRLLGDVIKRFEKRGFKLVGLKLLQANEGILSEHYHELRRKPFYHELIQYMTSGPVVAMVWEGHNVVKTSRAMVGETNPAEAKPGTVRGDFSVHVSR